MDDRVQEFESYKKQLDEIIRKGRDINFVDIEDNIKISIDFFIAYYSNEKYRARFTENQKQDVEINCYRPLVTAIAGILATRDWQSASPDSYRTEIRQAYRRLLEQGYLTRIEAAIGADSDALRNFDNKSKELLAEQRASLDAAQKAAQEAFENLEAQRIDVDRKIKQIDSRADKAAKSLARQVSSESGKVFLQDSDKYGGVAKNWLKVLIGSVSVAAILLTWLFIEVAKGIDHFSNNMFFSGLKVTTILILVYLIQICSKNYSANKHLQVTNKQRATVVAFVNTFVNSVEGEGYKDYLLTYASKTVFDHGETGFISRNYGAGSGDESGLDLLIANISKFGSK